MKMNLPNKLTVLRLFMVPVFVVIMMLSDALWASIAGLVLFVLASLTDMLDGKLARKYHLVTDFGKFLDPLADKFMVLGALLVILYRSMTDAEPNRFFCNLFFWATLLVIFRELAVTSIRLVASGSSGVVLAASMAGKIKTCVQISCVVACFLERILYFHVDVLSGLRGLLPLSLLTTVLMILATVWSGASYLRAYWKYLDPQK